MSDYKNELGAINIQKNIIHEIISAAADTVKGKGKLGNLKMRVPFLINDPNNCIKYEWTDTGLNIEISIIVQFGNSISGVAETLINNVFKGCNEILGIKPGKVTVIVTGTGAGSRQIRRNIKIERTG